MSWTKRPRWLDEVLSEIRKLAAAATGDRLGIKTRLDAIDRKLATIMSNQSTEQAEIEQDATTIEGLLTDLGTQSGNLNTSVENAQAAINALEQQVADGDAPDLTDLRSALSGVASAQQGIDSAVAGAANLTPQATPASA